MKFDREKKIFFGIPNLEDRGEYEIIVRVFDGLNGYANTSFSIEVFNESPLLNETLFSETL